MWLQDKKGVSIMVGYVLLVTFAVVVGIFVYQWIKTYVPTEALECPDGVSIFIKDVNLNCINFQMDLTLKNNGMFNIAGYFIHATNKTDQKLATIDLSSYTKLGEDKGGTVLFSTENSFKPNNEIKNVFDWGDSGIGRIYSIEIIPVRWQIEDNKKRFASCGGSRVKEMITCGVEVPETCEEVPISCDAGECDTCPQDCSHTDCCPDDTCNNEEICGDTDNDPECNSDCGVCTNVCGDGIVESPEVCDTGNLSGETCTSVMGAEWTGDLYCYPAGHAQECSFNTTGCTEEVGIQESIVFVSSASFNGNLGGISGADAECNTLASAAGLSGTFVAWLSDSTTDAKDGIPTDIPFNRTDGAKVADNLADLLDGSIDIKISVNENGAPPDDVKDSVWTGTNEFGVATTNNCNNWQSSASGDKGLKGKSDESTLKWTNENEETCDKIYRIYCFQIS